MHKRLRGNRPNMISDPNAGLAGRLTRRVCLSSSPNALHCLLTAPSATSAARFRTAAQTEPNEPSAIKNIYFNKDRDLRLPFSGGGIQCFQTTTPSLRRRGRLHPGNAPDASTFAPNYSATSARIPVWVKAVLLAL